MNCRGVCKTRAPTEGRGRVREKISHLSWGKLLAINVLLAYAKVSWLQAHGLEILQSCSVLQSTFLLSQAPTKDRYP